jgi:hypothetical protein
LRCPGNAVELASATVDGEFRDTGARKTNWNRVATFVTLFAVVILVDMKQASLLRFDERSSDPGRGGAAA